jgi:hypothetical protein
MIKYLIALIVSFSAFSVHSEELLCLSFDAAISILKEQYSEEPAMIARMENSDQIVTIMANKKTGTWTLLLIDKTGNVACPIMNGNKFIAIKGKSTNL